VHIVKIALFL
jgi:chromosome segregation ATPase